MGIFDALFGDGGEEDIRAAGQRAAEQLREGREESIATREGFLDRSTGILAPQVEAGRNVLAQLTGALSPDAREEAFQKSMETGIEAIDRSAAARGLRGSGGTQRALFDLGQRSRFAFDTDTLNQLQRLLGQTNPAAFTTSGQTFQTGRDVAGTQLGTSQQLAGNIIGTENAAQEAAQAPINNLLSLLGAGARIGTAASGLFNPPVEQPSANLPWLQGR